MDIQKLDCLVVGQLRTSRTEALENYLRHKARSLCVIGFMSPFAAHNESRCTLYEKGETIREFALPCFSIKNVTWWKQPLMILSFSLYIVSFFYALLRLRRHFDIYVGIATFSSLLGLLAKKMGFSKKVNYYCLDFYTAPPKLCFNSFINAVYKRADILCVKYADRVWDISDRIQQARQHFWSIPTESYKTVIVPLGYSNDIHRDISLETRERWTLGFVGTLSENQGLQMVVRSMPKLKNKFPDIKIRVVGHGPYADEIKQMVKEQGVEDQFIFHGFVQDDEDVYNILAGCMAGLATWTGDETDNSKYADPGKPKLYALLGLPIIITSAPQISGLIGETGAGEVIDYDIEQFIAATTRVLTSLESLKTYQKGVERFKPYCRAEDIFNSAFSESTPTLENTVSDRQTAEV